MQLCNPGKRRLWTPQAAFLFLRLIRQSLLRMALALTHRWPSSTRAGRASSAPPTTARPASPSTSSTSRPSGSPSASRRSSSWSCSPTAGRRACSIPRLAWAGCSTVFKGHPVLGIELDESMATIAKRVLGKEQVRTGDILAYAPYLQGIDVAALNPPYDLRWQPPEGMAFDLVAGSGLIESQKATLEIATPRPARRRAHDRPVLAALLRGQRRCARVPVPQVHGAGARSICPTCTSRSTASRRRACWWWQSGRCTPPATRSR